MTEQAQVNLPARVRMATLYAVLQSMKRRRIDLLHEKNLFKVKPMPGFEI